jgi:hypothetical protein
VAGVKGLLLQIALRLALRMGILDDVQVDYEILFISFIDSVLIVLHIYILMNDTT